MNYNRCNFFAVLSLIPVPFSLLAVKVLGTPIPAFVGLASLVAAAAFWCYAPYTKR